MHKKTFLSVGVFAVVIAIGVGIGYYCYPSTINNALGINNVSSSFPAGDDDLELDTATTTASAAQNINAGADDIAGDDSSGATPNGIATAPSSLPPAPVPTSTVPCTFPPAGSVPSTTREIIFNEIAWMGSPLSSTAEWMEIKNISSGPVDLSGWELLNASGKIKISFSDTDGAIAPGGLLLLSRGTTTPAAAEIYSGDLANTGDILALIDPQCGVSDYLDASGGWPAGNNTTKATLERDADGVGWHTSALPGGTPGVENSAGPVAPVAPSSTPAPVAQNITPTENIMPPPADSFSSAPNSTTSSDDEDIGAAANSDANTTNVSPSSSTESASDSDGANAAAIAAPSSSNHVLIALVQIAGASSSNDFMKLYNPTASAIDMSGWKLHKKSSTGDDYSLKVFPSGSVIPAGGSFIWANSEDGFSDSVGANVSSTETLATDNSVALMDAAGNIVDAVAWGTGTDQYGEGPPYPTSPGANQLLSRRSSDDGAMADTGDNSNDFTIQ